MKKYYYLNSIVFILFIFSIRGLRAQEIVSLSSHLSTQYSSKNVEEKISYNDAGEVISISGVTEPSMSVYLPDPRNATGTAVVILPGGALRFLSWENEGTKVAKWLNEKGIAAFILKYRLDNSEMQMGQGNMPPMMLSLKVDQFDQLENANANPSPSEHSTLVADNAGNDAQEAIRVVRERAEEWGIDNDKVGFLGFSAGGAVALDAIIRNQESETMPNFIASIYGPSTIDVTVPSPIPPLFIATAADHMNVAAGCLALFTTWKHAGGEAEIHIYGKGKSAFGMTQKNLPSDSWIDSFYLWLKSGGF